MIPTSIIIRRLYQSLLRSSAPFSIGKSSKILSSLLHRSGIRNDEDNKQGYKNLIRNILEEVIGGDSTRLFRFPSEIPDDEKTVRDIIRREFRISSSSFSSEERIKAAFFALKVLNEKLFLANSLGLESKIIKNKRENTVFSSDEVRKISLFSSLEPGSFLVAHPLLPGYFSRSIIVILDTTSEGIYGLITNRHAWPLKRVMNHIPKSLDLAFRNSVVHEGGPVSATMQMIYNLTPGQELRHQIGGIPLPNSNFYYRGDLFKAAQKVIDNQVPSSNFFFFVGASCWQQDQLEQELNKGFWMLVRAPIEKILLLNKQKDNKYHNYNDDLWLSIINSISTQDASLAKLISNEQEENTGNNDNKRIHSQIPFDYF